MWLALALTLSGLGLLFLAAHHTSIAQSSQTDLVVINAKVRTMTEKNSVVEAFAVSGNRIVAVGTSKYIRTFMGPSTKVIDAKGQLVLPGFNDAHVHFLAIGNSFSSLDLRTARQASDMVAQIERFTRFLPDGRWILGGNFRTEESDLPGMDTLDRVAPDNPVFLYHADGNSGLANRLAFRRTGVKEQMDGVARDVHGKPTGVVRGQALRRIASAIPPNHTREWPAIAETATNYAASLGVTSVQDVHSDDSRQIYLDLARKGKLKTRVYDCVPLPDWQRLRDARLEAKPGGMVTDGCLKSFSDGDEESGVRLGTDAAAADKAGLQIMVHAIGRNANRIVLDVFERTAKVNGRRDRRFRIEHADRAGEENLGRFKPNHVIASMQPFLFAGGEGSRYGTLLKQDTRVAFGSDAPMVDLNPLHGIQTAAMAGDESISVFEAVRAYTTGSSYAEFQEKNKGTIERGKLADFIILSDDIFAVDPKAIHNARVTLTVVDGRVVYSTSL